MQLIRLLVAAVAGIAVVVGYIHERRRLEVISKLPGDKARDYYEAGRARNERVMWVVALALLIAAVTIVLGQRVLPSFGAAA